MNRFTLLTSIACVAAVVALAAPAAAQTTDKPAAKPAAAAASKPVAKAAAKPAAKPAAKADAKSDTKTAAKPVAKALPAASPEQLTAADRALKGNYDCDFNQKITVATNSNSQGYVDVTSGKNKYTMKPMITSTGTLRMEDVTGRMLLMQIANKSMLMDTKLGQRVVDNCVHPTQKS